MNEKKSIKEFFCTNSGGVVLTIIVYAVTLILMALIGSISNNVTGGAESVVGVIGIILFIIWTVLGWKALSMIQPRIFLIMPIAGWVIYFVIKGFLSMLLGIFIAPYHVAKIIRNKLLDTI